MAKRKKAARTTISVPAELHKRMGQVNTPVNWSSLATQAFEAKLRDIAAEKLEDSIMESALKRLRGLAAEEESAATAAGHQAGRDWACETATPRELRRLSRMSDEELADVLDYDATNAFSPPERLALALLPDDKKKRADTSRFWSEALGTNPRDLEEDFLRGFVDGALEVWIELEPRL